jgi:hypothetical protein
MAAENPIEYEKGYAGDNGEITDFYNAHKNLDEDALFSAYRELQEQARRSIKFIKFKESDHSEEKIGSIKVTDLEQSKLEEVFKNLNSLHKIFKEKNINPPPNMEERGI